MTKSTNAPNIDFTQGQIMFAARAVLFHRPDDMHETPYGNYMRGMYQAFQMARLYRDGQIDFTEGLATGTNNAVAMYELKVAGLVDIEVANNDPEPNTITYRLTDEGEKLARWMLEGLKTGK